MREKLIRKITIILSTSFKMFRLYVIYEFNQSAQYKHTKSNITVVQQVAEMIKHGPLIMPTDSTEITKETTAVRNHLRKHDFLNEARG